MSEPTPILRVERLSVAIRGVQILRDVSFSVDAGATLGIVGESGCGKSMTGLALMGMLPPGGKVTQGSVVLDGRDLLRLSPKEWLEVRGQEIAMVMQDPFTSLNPMMRVGDQIAEVWVLHQGLSWKEARMRAVEILGHVGVPDPAASSRKFPHQMSGGQRQRVVIACAFAARPKVLVADEPTTALDVTLQAQILHLLKDLQREAGTAVVLISHDVGVIGSVSDTVAVFYAGRIVEQGPVRDVLTGPRHPYTEGLLGSLPRPGLQVLESIQGQPPLFTAMPAGCPFRPRCPNAHDRCQAEPGLVEVAADHRAACWLHDPARPIMAPQA
ncbi:MAG: ABC transporter ATP-binding protein [Fimbriimonadaceae bacterium]|nr:ABC transporter ATP-binding protein [Fimbriimonadaceae bacterium]QYK57635.1 MAG: ABC transporter ATP-binding protein [Fimbriimonadaceae bacterium]